MKPTHARAGSDYFVTGGALRPDEPSYLSRDADTIFYVQILQGHFC